MERSTQAAMYLAGASVIAVLAITGKPGPTVGQAILVGFPLLLIAFPDAIESGHRLTYRGRIQGGQPTPGVVLWAIGWVSLIAAAIGGPAVKISQLG